MRPVNSHSFHCPNSNYREPDCHRPHWPALEELNARLTMHTTGPKAAPEQSSTCNPAPLPTRWQRRLLTLATGLILTMIGWSNLPNDVPQKLLASVEQQGSPQLAYRLRWVEWAVRWGAHLSGLDNKWQMYGLQSRFTWRYEIIATYSDGAQQIEWLLPLPRQSQRTLWQRLVVDFKEAKFDLNIYNDSLARETYAHYLARQFPEHQGCTLQRIRYDLKYQYILPPAVAVKEQQLLEDWVETNTISNFDVSAVVASQLGTEPKPLLPAGPRQALTINQ
jgi:hypothetical protein